MSKPKVTLVGQDGNAFAIIGACRKAWRTEHRGNPTKLAEWPEIQNTMMAGDYDHLLATVRKYFNVK